MTAIAPPSAPIAPTKKATSTIAAHPIGGGSSALQPTSRRRGGLGSRLHGRLVRDDSSRASSGVFLRLFYKPFLGPPFPVALPAPLHGAGDADPRAAEGGRPRADRRRRRADHPLRDRQRRSRPCGRRSSGSTAAASSSAAPPPTPGSAATSPRRRAPTSTCPTTGSRPSTPGRRRPTTSSAPTGRCSPAATTRAASRSAATPPAARSRSSRRSRWPRWTCRRRRRWS